MNYQHRLIDSVGMCAVPCGAKARRPRELRLFKLFKFSQLVKLALASAALAGMFPAQALSLDEALRAAEMHAPELMASRFEANTAEQLKQSAGALPDPRIALYTSDYPLAGETANQFRQSKRGLSLMQDVPNSSKREAARRSAEVLWQNSELQHAFTRLGVRRETSLAWLAIYHLARKNDVLLAQEKDLRLKSTLTRAQLAGGQSADMALAAQLEEASLADTRDDLARELVRSRAQLARFVGEARAGEDALGPLPSWLEANLQEKSLINQPELRRSALQIEAANAELAMARADKIPDWGVELGLEKDSMGSNMAMLKFNFSLPIFSGTKQNPNIKAALSNIERARADDAAKQANYQQQQSEWRAEQDSLSAQLRRLRESVFPLLEKQVKLALANFSGGKGNAALLVDARRARLLSQLREIDLQQQLAVAKAQLYFIQGEDSDNEVHE